jgi:hypothetical protein
MAHILLSIRHNGGNEGILSDFCGDLLRDNESLRVGMEERGSVIYVTSSKAGRLASG